MKAALFLCLDCGPLAGGAHVALAHDRLAPLAGSVVHVGHAPPPGCRVDRHLPLGDVPQGAALAAALPVLPESGAVILYSAQALGPVAGRGAQMLERFAAEGLALISAWARRDVPGPWDHPSAGAGWLPDLSFAVADAALLRAIAARPAPFRPGAHLRWAAAGGEGAETIPALHAPAAALDNGAAALPADLLTLDPLLHDAAAIDLPAALAWLRRHDPPLAGAIAALGRTRLPPRDWAGLSGGLFIPDGTAQDLPPETEVAIFLHAYEAHDFPALYEAAARLPCRRHFYVTTGSAESAGQIGAALERADEQACIRIPAENRGRDMAALFITFRDIALSGRHDIALRLHGKRSPHLAPQVAAAFRAHLLENLAASPAHAAAIIARFQAEPRLGLVQPPAVHHGLGPLGHGWSGNRDRLLRVARELGLRGPFDTLTPLAPYGTMFWFRPAALAPLFERRWRHGEYNAEPHHLDGGLAHVQERLISYAAQSAGYAIAEVMTPQAAARAYQRLEYKHQRLAGLLASPSIVLQEAELAARRPRPFALALRAIAAAWGALARRHPRLLRRLTAPLRRLARMG